MKNAFSHKVSYFILTFLFLIIGASFLFSNFDNFSLGTSQEVASVDGSPITIKEYSGALKRQIDFFSQMTGGKGITEKQLEQMGIKESVLNELIEQKLLQNIANKIGLVISQDEIKSEIKKLPYFKTKDKFDVNLYRNLLQSNGYTPSQFEELIANGKKQDKVNQFFSTFMISENYSKDILKFKNNLVVTQALKISRQNLAPLVSVSEKEIEDYLAKAENQKTIQSAYNENLNKYNKPEEIRARHILIKGEDQKSLEKINAIKSKVNAKNFQKIAEKETEDPSGKSNGGDLGWFSSGRMVPEFEKVAFNLKIGEISGPVKTPFGYHLIYVESKRAAETRTLDSVKSELARIEIQKAKGTDLDKLLQTTSSEIKNALEKGDFVALESISKKVEGQLFNNTEINQYNQALGSLQLSPSEAEKIFNSTPGTILDFGNSGTIFLVKIIGNKTGKEFTSEVIKAEVSAQRDEVSRRIREEFNRHLKNQSKIVTNRSLL